MRAEDVGVTVLDLATGRAERVSTEIAAAWYWSPAGSRLVVLEPVYDRDGPILVQTCEPRTELCIATDLTLDSERIETRTVGEWRKNLPDINKKPTIFLLYRPVSR